MIPLRLFHDRIKSFSLLWMAAALVALASFTMSGTGVAHAETANPHGAYNASTKQCASCHLPHDAGAAKLLKDAVSGELGVCFSCHDGTGATSNVKTGPADSFALVSGHSLENTGTGADLTNTCSGCHSLHRTPSATDTLWAGTVNGAPVSARGNAWCLACHNDAQDWYVQKFGTAYPAPASPSSDASGFPVYGTFPGATVYNDSAKNAHVGIPAASAPATKTAGDCLWCHAPHRSASRYDSLVATLQAPVAATLAADRTSGAFAGLCFGCHDGSWVASGAVDVKRFVTYNGASDSAYSGHRIKSVAASLPVNAPLPCYECHGPHGSSRGNKTLIADSRGASLDTGSGAAGVRAFCLTCHTTSDGKVWDSGSSAYVAVPAGARIVGLSRDGGAIGSGPDLGKNWLLLKDLSGHAQGDATSCYTCHGSDYSAAAGSNVHDPGPGVSAGGVDCYSCHASYRIMDANDGSRTTVYHHVMGTGGGTYTGGLAPNAGAYPTSTANLYCVSCHADHNYFNAAKGFNLRTDISASTVTTAATDFVNDAGSSYGICVSCHKVALAKDTTGQKAGSATTPKIVGADYAASSHRYSVNASFGPAPTSVFGADCSKCHNDEQSKTFQTSTYSFGTHLSAERRLLESFGAPVTDPLRETDCFGCHSATTDVTGGTTKPIAGRDAYGTAGASMDASSQMTFKVFRLNAVSKHGDDTGAGLGPEGYYVSCSSCHNPHTSSATTKVADPFNLYNGMAYSTTDQKAAFCLKCHNGSSYPMATASGATWVAVTMQLNGGWAVDKAANAARGHWSASGSISAGERMSCDVCHDKHGSKVDNLLGVYNPSNGKMEIRGTEITANDESVCFACHTAATAGYPTFTRGAQGYPVDGAWPGKVVSDSYSKHGSCASCHNVHGGSSPQDALSGFTATDFSGCMFCHSLSAFGLIKPYYPTTAGGSGVQTAATRFGHRTKTAGDLAAGSPVPCYDCHNPHGSPSASSLVVVTQSQGVAIAVGDGAGELSMAVGSRSGAQVRQFCFACHTTSDTAKGWTGSVMEVALATDQVEGISRVTVSGGQVLHLPDLAAHQEGSTQSCYDCHGEDYSLPASNNVHNPGSGMSSGGQDCYGCHLEYQTSMEDGLPNKTGATRADAYHHVLGGPVASFWDGDRAFAAGSYPTATGDVYCLSCHVDHDKFNSSKSGNLRPDITTLNPAGAATDYSTGSNAGVCTGCHATSLTKQVSTDQKDDGSVAAPKIVAGAGANQFGASAHSYYATSTFGDSSTFNANCSKCHNDEQSEGYQTSANTFGLHWSASRRLVSVFGMAVTDPASEERCYGCHSGDAAGNDVYGTAAMTQAARRIETQFALTGSKHPVVAAGGDSVECESCHNAHVVTKTTGKVTDPANTYNTIGFATTAEQSTFCLKCHSAAGSLPVYTVNASTYVPSSVTIALADQAVMDKSANAARSHWVANGSIAAGSEKSCAVCHESHGSAYPKLLGAYDPATGTNRVGGAAITGNNNTVCAACHSSADALFPVAVRNAAGYPVDGTWPGGTVFAGANGIHSSRLCGDCHDVHGTANDYDEIVGAFLPNDFGSCFTCHDGDPSTRNIRQYYPTANDGTATQLSTTNFGHKIQTPTGLLAAGEGMPCYDCHNPHGSGTADGLLVLTANNNTTYAIGDAAGEIDMSSVAGRRQFCFLCHTTADATAQGTDYTDGVGYVNITNAGTSKVEGIDRTVYDSVNKRGLKLPPLNGHYAGDTTKDCYTCHLNDYSNAISNNVHNPGPGVSTGGTDCYTCHAAMQSPMEDSTGTKTGATNGNWYHHILGSATNDGDKAFASSSYPAGGTDVFCLSCHVDHDKFNASKSGNLRSNASAGTPVAANTDFVSGSGTEFSATAFANSTGTWTNTGNSLGAGNGTVATSPGNNVFDGRHTFTLGALSSIPQATLTVRSRAVGMWGQSGTMPLTTYTPTLLPTADGAKTGTWAYTSGSTGFNLVNDNVDTTYITSPTSASNTYMFAVPSANVPAGATINSVAIFIRAQRTSASATTNLSRMTCGATTANDSLAAFDTTRNSWGDTTRTWATPPGGGSWSPATVNNITAIGVAHTNTTTPANLYTQIELRVSYTVPSYSYAYDDKWAIQYTTDGTTWSNVVAANSTSEASLTDHVIDLSGILTPSNCGNFAVRILGSATGTADNAGAVEWDSSTLVVSPGNGVCLGCHALALAKGVNQKAEAGSTKTPPIAAPAYDASAHDYEANSTFGDGTAFRGNCVKCHSDEQAKQYQSSTVKFGTHYSAQRRILAALGVTVTDPPHEEGNCFRCHSLVASGLKSTANRDWYNAVAMSASAQSLFSYSSSAYRHDTTAYAGKHLPSPADETQTYLSANKHVECADCHDSHAATVGTHATGTNAASNAIKGATGLTWSAGTSTNWSTTGSTLTAVDGVSKEYEICLKCHSRANTALTTWNAGWTDVALEFSTANQSYHPVFGPIRAGRDIPAAYMKAPWNTNLTTQTMYCSDCHMDNVASPAAEGPHGSAQPHLLKGVWTGSETLGALPADFLCSKCHTLPTDASANTPHAKGQHQVFPCTDCHIARPHGGRVPRLIATVNAPAPYGSSPQLESINFPVGGTGDCDTVLLQPLSASLLGYYWP